MTSILVLTAIAVLAYIIYKKRYLRILSDQKIGVREASGSIVRREGPGWKLDVKPFWHIAQEYPKSPFAVDLGVINVNTCNGYFQDDAADPGTRRFVSAATIGIRAGLRIFFPDEDRILELYRQGITPEQGVLESLFRDIARELLLTVAGKRTWPTLLADVRSVEDAVNDLLKKEFAVASPDDRRVWARVGFQYRDIQFVIPDIILPDEIRKERDGVSARRFARESARIRAEEDAFKLLEPVIHMKARARGLTTDEFMEVLKGNTDLQEELAREASDLRVRYLSAEHGALHDFRLPTGGDGGALPIAAVLGALLGLQKGGAVESPGKSSGKEEDPTRAKRIREGKERYAAWRKDLDERQKQRKASRSR